jgi:hypothetical protein
MIKNTLNYYHIFNAPRPWVFSQWYLTPEARPVDLAQTIELLALIAASGLLLMFIGTALFSPLPIGERGRE